MKPNIITLSSLILLGILIGLPKTFAATNTATKIPTETTAKTETADTVTTCANRPVFGGSEKVQLVNQHLTLEAKLDTGAAMASLSAVNIITTQRGHQTWLQFTVIVPKSNQKLNVTAPLLRYTRILKRSEESVTDTLQTHPGKTNEAQYSRRPVIALPICLGRQRRTILVNLIDRTHFQYPMLLGAQTLKQFHALVDPSHHLIAPPACAA